MIVRSAFLKLNQVLYGMIRPILFRSTAQVTHERLLYLLRWVDGQRWLYPFIGLIYQLGFPSRPITVGGVTLQFPLILAAGMVKGDGFEFEEAALDAAQRYNIMPGWKSLPRMIGLVEFGSFTRWPRMGNPGTVVWRDIPTRSTQNRVGLRNPGAVAAATFLAARRDQLPEQFGINIAVSPGVNHPQQQLREIQESLAAFLERGIRPTWFTINFSCPNTEDDPCGNQTADEARLICQAAVKQISPTPLWVKIGPTLADEQYCALMQVFAEVGVKAVIATNTQPMPTPDNPTLTAGVAGGRLHTRAVEVARLLTQTKSGVDIIGCGGIDDQASYKDFTDLGIQAVQYWSALVYRGPLAAALIER